MGAVCFFETLLFTYKSTWCYNPEDQHRHTTLPVVLYVFETRSRTLREEQGGCLRTQC
jgi:hypothetical protein